MSKIPSSFSLQCLQCSASYDSSSSNLTCSECGGSLEATYDYEDLRSNFSGVPSSKMRGVWRFAPILPLTERTRPITLGEGDTPLVIAERIGAELRLKNLYVKDESRNPTLSFKDRKSSVAISKALEFGARAVVSMTAGNAGSSIAAYASKAGLTAYIFTMKGISDSKLAKLVSYGGRVFKTRVGGAELLPLVSEISKRYGFTNLTAASRYNPYIKEGAKTAVFEIYESLGARLPDWLILPIGGGGNLSSYFKGLREMKQLGLIEGYPRIVGVQGKYCAPVVQAYEKGLEPSGIPTVTSPRTIAHSILDEWAPDGDQALRAIRETNGTAIGVTDAEILESMKWLSSKEGLFVEPASAAPLAALRRLVRSRTIDGSESVVMVATGFGSNQPEAALRAWGRTPTIAANLKAFEGYAGR